MANNYFRCWCFWMVLCNSSTSCSKSFFSCKSSSILWCSSSISFSDCRLDTLILCSSFFDFKCCIMSSNLETSFSWIKKKNAILKYHMTFPLFPAPNWDELWLKWYLCPENTGSLLRLQFEKKNQVKAISPHVTDEMDGLLDPPTLPSVQLWLLDKQSPGASCGYCLVPELSIWQSQTHTPLPPRALGRGVGWAGYLEEAVLCWVLKNKWNRK